MKREKSLVILAAGMGTRFQGGIKQLQKVGPAGECIMDYSVYDAVNAGFTHVVFILRRELAEQFEAAAGRRIRTFCEGRGVHMDIAFQDVRTLPAPFCCPEGREKPWGTGQALLCCREYLKSGFAVINADDYYGAGAFRAAAQFLDSHSGDRGIYALVGFHLGNTLSDAGSVTRGLCHQDGQGWLTDIRETRQVIKTSDGVAAVTPEGNIPLDAQMPVSMNLWAFTPDVLDLLQARFTDFLENGGLESDTGECLIPVEIGAMVRSGTVRVQVLPTVDRWFGMTYAEDIPLVKNNLAQMTAEGSYPSPLS